MILPPYQFSLDDLTDMSLEDAWHARPQLIFKCILRHQNGRPPKNPSWTRGPDDLEATLVFYAWQGATLSLFPARQRYSYHLKASAFQYGIADAAAVDGRRGSNVYEVNP